MDLELVTIGTELVLGFTIDTNGAELSRALASVGARVVRRTTVGDDEATIGDAVRLALGRTGFVITTGGLGPTRDDVTKRVVAEIFDAPLVVDESYLEVLRERFSRLGHGRMPESNRSQAEIPTGATVLTNRWGTAPGLWLDGPAGSVVMLPGVPREMSRLLEYEVLPRLRARLGASQAGGAVTLSRTLRTTGITESALADRLGGLEERLVPATLAYLPGFDGVDLRLTVSGVDAAQTAAILTRAGDALVPALGAHLYGEGDVDLARVVLDRCREDDRTLAVAESCTGGLLGARLTAIPGASDVFLGGVIAYADRLKAEELGVPREAIESTGAVSEPVVRAMVTGVMRRFGAGAGIAVTGIAGPGGGTAEKPVGTVWLAAAVGSRQEAVLRRFPGDRDSVRRRSAQAGLDLLRKMLGKGEEGRPALPSRQ